MKYQAIVIVLFFIVLLGNKYLSQGRPQPGKSPVFTSPAPLKENRDALVGSIAFGSCGSQEVAQPVLTLAARQNPGLFIFLGDNIYGDTYEMDTLRAKYRRLSAKPEFQQLKNSTRLIATWDDHDFGWNDSGRHYPFKVESKDIFLDFWKVPKEDVRRGREGIYTSYYFEGDGKVLQAIVLDTRTFRDNLLPYEEQEVDKERFHYHLDYWPHQSADSTLLGEAQWAWLEKQFAVPADLRIIASSTQFGITYNGYEAWANFPHEQERMVELIKKTKANGVVFISGDVRYSEISKLRKEGCYPLYDITSSGITSTWRFATPNDNRIAGPVMENNYGVIDVDWDKEDPELTMKVTDVEGKLRFEHKVALSELQF